MPQSVLHAPSEVRQPCDCHGHWPATSASIAVETVDSSAEQGVHSLDVIQSLCAEPQTHFESEEYHGLMLQSVLHAPSEVRQPCVCHGHWPATSASIATETVDSSAEQGVHSLDVIQSLCAEPQTHFESEEYHGLM